MNSFFKTSLLYNYYLRELKKQYLKVIRILIKKNVTKKLNDNSIDMRIIG